MSEATSVGPAADRIELVDALRGLALLGILLANILVFSGWIFLSPQSQAALAGSNGAELQHFLHKFLIDGKFYTLFSLLFGAGFALQLDRLTKRGADGLRIYRRRVLILLAIGMVHSWLIWDGDILVVYALMGLILPLFVRLPDRRLLLWSVFLIVVVPIAGVWLFKAAGWPPDAGLKGFSDRMAVAIAGVDPKDGIGWLRRADFQAWLAWVASGPFFSWGLRLESWRIPKVLGIMLLGIWIGRRLAAGTLQANKPLLKAILLAGLAVGLPLNVVYALKPDQSQSDWPSLLGTVPLALAYASAFVLAWPRVKGALILFAWPGRMALTNYLSQSVICILLFWGIGFDQVGRWPPFGFYAFAVGLFAAQALFSWWWLQHHAQGPMEALWRRWTYAGTKPLTGARAAV